jgi:hypothetical protein
MISRSSSTTAPLARLVRACGLAVSTLWLLGACCNPLDEDCVEPPPVDAGPDEAVDCDEPGACAIANCDVSTIRDDAQGNTCATCPSDNGDAEICGQPQTARCESRENARGDGCSICATDDGTILYDSCLLSDPGQVANCERSEQPVGPDEPNGEPGAVEELVCETCTDFDGNVVSTECEPVSDECELDVVDEQSGLICRVCTRDGEVVVRDCEQPIITPRSCEAYENELGRCIDCFGDNDELLTHFCTLTEDTFISCRDEVTPEGLRCSTCFDQNGAQIDRFCDQIDPTLQQCALLDYSEQSCVVCLGVDGFPALLECQRTDCDAAGNEECPAPPDCEFEFSEDGALCRTCPTDAGELEQECVVETNLQCEQLFDEFTGGVCLSCKDVGSGVEVFRRCDNGSLPPTCFFQDDGTGSGDVCEVCLDSESQNGDQIYAACPAHTCYDAGQYELFSPQGGTLFVDNAVAVADCSECAATSDDGVTTADDYQAVCTLRTDCPVDLVNPDAACEGTVSFTVRPRVCENPWELAGFQSGFQANALEMLDIMSFALDAGGVGVVAAQYQGVDPNTPPGTDCVDQCGCERGDLVNIVVRPDEAAPIVELFSDILDRCASDADCREGATCRIDGGCG